MPFKLAMNFCMQKCIHFFRIGLSSKKIKPEPMEKTSTDEIVTALTRAIVERRLLPGSRLAEQKLADHFSVSRTIARQALHQLSQNHLISITRSRGASVATPSVEEAKQVFELRRMLEAEMIRKLVPNITQSDIRSLKEHLKSERNALSNLDGVKERTELLGDFHVLLAKVLRNDVLVQVLKELISRCSLITMMYQSGNAAKASTDAHEAIVNALMNKDTKNAVKLTLAHLDQVEESLTFDRKGYPNDFSYSISFS